MPVSTVTFIPTLQNHANCIGIDKVTRIEATSTYSNKSSTWKNFNSLSFFHRQPDNMSQMIIWKFKLRIGSAGSQADRNPCIFFPIKSLSIQSVTLPINPEEH